MESTVQEYPRCPSELLEFAVKESELALKAISFSLDGESMLRFLGLNLNVSRATKYRVLRELRRSGQVSYQKRGGRFYYAADKSKMNKSVVPPVLRAEPSRTINDNVKALSKVAIEDHLTLRCLSFGMKGPYIGLTGPAAIEHINRLKSIATTFTIFENNADHANTIEEQLKDIPDATLIRGNIMNLEEGVTTALLDADTMGIASIETYYGLRRLVRVLCWESVGALRFTVCRRQSPKDFSREMLEMLIDDAILYGLFVMESEYIPYKRSKNSAPMATGQIIFTTNNKTAEEQRARQPKVTVTWDPKLGVQYT